MRSPCAARRGITRVDLIALAGFGIVALFLVAGLLLPKPGSAFETQRSEQCRANLRQLATALRQYADTSRVGELPGYMNALERQDGFAYHDPRTGRVEPVSWVVMILPELGETDATAAWRSGDSPTEGKPIGAPAIERTHRYLEYLICPSDPQPSRMGTPICYGVNTGIPDFLAGPDGERPIDAAREKCRCAACRGKAIAESEVELVPARDHGANGLFFDRFTSSRHFDPARRT